MYVGLPNVSLPVGRQVLTEACTIFFYKTYLSTLLKKR